MNTPPRRITQNTTPPAKVTKKDSNSDIVKKIKELRVELNELNSQLKIATTNSEKDILKVKITQCYTQLSKHRLQYNNNEDY